MTEGGTRFESVIVRKLDANFSVIGSSIWTAMVPVALGFVVYLLWRAPGHVQAIRDTIRESLPGLAVVGFLGFALNDSGIAVPGVMLGVVNASLVYLAMQIGPRRGGAGVERRHRGLRAPPGGRRGSPPSSWNGRPGPCWSNRPCGEPTTAATSCRPRPGS